MLNRTILLAMTIAVPAFAQTATPEPYLAPGSLDILQSLAPAPVKGDARYAADRKIFKQTRKLVGTPRYALATHDVDYTLPTMMGNFSCAAGIVLSPTTAPRLALVMARAGRDTQATSGAGKDHYKRLRPFQIDRGKTCQPGDELKGSFDYPSGHTTWGWTWGTLLSELLPDRASAIESRARAYGESRIICGVHNASAVEAGRNTATATLAVVHASPEFQADFAAARTELAALRTAATPPDAAACAIEAGLVAQRPY